MRFITKYLIRKAKAGDLEEILNAVLARYAEVFPQWEVSVLSVEKEQNRNAQIDGVIAVLERMKT